MAESLRGLSRVVIAFDKRPHGFWVGDRAILFSIIDGEPILIMKYHAEKFLSDGYVNHPDKAERPDKESIKITLRKIKVFIEYTKPNMRPRLAQYIETISDRMCETLKILVSKEEG